MEGLTINNFDTQTTSRRQIAYTSICGTTKLHLRNPFTIAIWSMLFPGAGHYLLYMKFVSYLLFIWELFINYKAKINIAILYSFLGKFDMAKEVLNIQWMLLYLPTYFFAIWDSYRKTAEMNSNYLLAVREDAPVKPFKMNSWESNYLVKRNPFAGFAWSMMMPGMGLLYNHHIFCSLFILSSWIVIIYFSNLLPAIHYSLLGHFELAKEIVNPQWLLNIPSIYCFSAYASYVDTVENNKLYEWELSKFLKENYQYEMFIMPSLNEYNGGLSMYIISTFEQTNFLELALTALEMKGIDRKKILAIPLDKKAEDKKLFNTLHNSDGLSLFDLPIILATLGSLFGGIYGFIWEWGPIIWGLLGFFIFFAVGFVIKLITTRKYRNKQKKEKSTEVVVIIECIEEQLEMAKNILWEHHALGIRKLDLGTNEKI